MQILRTSTIQGLLLLIILTTAAALYWPALSGGLQFDDQQNLEGLAAVVNLESVIQFAFSGQAGPLGRPLALASFAMQAYAWPDNPEIFLRGNILLHALNGALLAWCLLWLGRLRGMPEQQAGWAAIAATALWLVIPLLASSSLLIVQRMATLSATFVLAGMLGYLAARARLHHSPGRALLGMSAALGLGTVLATLSKENGALLPVLLLVIECTLLRGRLFASTNLARCWGFACLVLPLLAILAFLASKVPYPHETVLSREFTAGQRLWTQAEILWQYLLHAFVPMPANLTPFHDQARPSPSVFQTSTLLAIGTWLLVVGTAFHFRKRLPLLAFAVFWYLTAHLLESTVLNLELYFAHRNYLALIGPIYAIAASTLAVSAPLGKLARTLLVGYTLALAASLHSFTSLWGQPDLAAEMWAIYRPDSTRANQHLATLLHQNGWHGAALKVLDETFIRDSERNLVAGVQALTLACAMHPQVDQAKRIESLVQQARTVHTHPDLAQNLLELHRLIQKEPCSGVTSKDIEQIALTALANPAYKGASFVRQNLYAVLIELAIARQDFAETMSLIEESLRTKPSLERLHLALKVLIDGGRPDLGQGFIENVKNRMPKHPIQRLEWQRQLALMEQQLAEITATNQAQGAR